MDFSINQFKGDLEPTAQPEHATFATQVANEITSGRFTPDQENEIVFLIINMTKEHRNARVCEAEKHMAYLKSTYEKLLNQK